MPVFFLLDHNLHVYGNNLTEINLLSERISKHIATFQQNFQWVPELMRQKYIMSIASDYAMFFDNKVIK